MDFTIINALWAVLATICTGCVIMIISTLLTAGCNPPWSKLIPALSGITLGTIFILFCSLLTAADYVKGLHAAGEMANLEIHRLRVYERECITRGIATATIVYKNSYMVLQAEDGNEADK